MQFRPHTPMIDLNKLFYRILYLHQRNKHRYNFKTGQNIEFSKIFLYFVVIGIDFGTYC